LAITLQGFPNLEHLIGMKADLTGFATGITDVQNPKGVAFGASTFRTTGRMINGALEQGAAKDIAKIDELGSQLVPSANQSFACHL